jgi:hypothetical protein
VFEDTTNLFSSNSITLSTTVIPFSGTKREVELSDLTPYSMILSLLKIDTGSMTKKEKVMKLVDESTGLMECLVCGAKHTAVMKPGPDGKYLPENWECVNRCKLIHHEENSSKKK